MSCPMDLSTDWLLRLAHSSSKQNYAEVGKEALSLIFGVKRFHSYLYGRHFTIVTDHKPLTAILGPKKGIPPLAAARLQRWAWILSGSRRGRSG